MILIITAVFPPEPVVSANLSFDIASELAKNHEVTVISPKPTRPLNKVLEHKTGKNYLFNHQVLKSYTCPESSIAGRLLESYSFGKATARYIHQHHKKIELIYANTWPLIAQQFLIYVASKYHIPVVLHIQDIYPESLIAKLPSFIGKIIRSAFIPFDRYDLQNSAHVIAISPQMKSYLMKSRKLHDSKIHVIRNWQNDEHFLNFQTVNATSKQMFRFMYLGSINPSAGVEMLISAFAKADLPGCSLIIAGNGSSKDSCEKLAMNFPKSNIEFWDAPLELVPEIQAQASVLLLPLKKGIGKTASPSKLAAYLFSKKPVIASVDSESDPADIIQTAQCGWVIEPENIGLMAETMKMVSEVSAEELQAKGKNGFDYAMINLSKKKNLELLTTIIKESIPA
jgi:glycosyltransferase involved in cell wall biosynthesis